MVHDMISIAPRHKRPLTVTHNRNIYENTSVKGTGVTKHAYRPATSQWELPV